MIFTTISLCGLGLQAAKTAASATKYAQLLGRVKVVVPQQYAAAFVRGEHEPEGQLIINHYRIAANMFDEHNKPVHGTEHFKEGSYLYYINSGDDESISEGRILVSKDSNTVADVITNYSYNVAMLYFAATATLVVFTIEYLYKE